MSTVSYNFEVGTSEDLVMEELRGNMKIKECPNGESRSKRRSK